MQRIEDQEFDEIPLVADSIFAFIKLHETDKSIPERDLQILKATTYNDLGYYYNESNIHTKGLQYYLLAYSTHSKWNSTGVLLLP
ncbi:MAG: hypothetical protein IPP29_18425 [Bacteroidetes bacterium]|nr:hypothetical protein [Bacteroidota bacterium]